MISRSWREEAKAFVPYIIAGLLLGSILLLLSATALHAQTPTPTPGQRIQWACKPGQVAVWVGDQPGCWRQGEISGPATNVAPYPGYWHVNSVKIPHYAPCPSSGKLVPYTHFTDPDTPNEGYFRYDFQSYRWPITSCPGLHSPPCEFASAGGPNHSTTWVPGAGLQANYEVPIWAEQTGPNYYPVPTGASDICAQWLAVGNTAICPGLEGYVNAMQVNSTYAAGYTLALPIINSDPGCQSGAVTPSRTPTPTTTRTPSPTGPTPTPTANLYAQYIEALARAKVTGGCGAGAFCPSFTLTREQAAVWLVKASQAGPMLLLPCQTPPAFIDVRCDAAVTAKVGP